MNNFQVNFIFFSLFFLLFLIWSETYYLYLSANKFYHVENNKRSSVIIMHRNNFSISFFFFFIRLTVILNIISISIWNYYFLKGKVSFIIIVAGIYLILNFTCVWCHNVATQTSNCITTFKTPILSPLLKEGVVRFDLTAPAW